MKIALHWLVGSCTLSVLATGCGGCEDGAGPSGARFEFTNQGTGEPNTQPLDPMWQGSLRPMWNATLRSKHDVIDGTVDLPAGRAIRLVELDTAEVTYWIRDEVGLFVAGNSFDGLFPHPALMIPATVRDGMTWDVWLDDGDAPTFSYSVTRDPPTDGPFGMVTTWRIAESQDGREIANETYQEGFGPLYRSTIPPVLPHNPDPAPVSYPRYELEPISIEGGSNSIQYYAAPRGISVVRVPGYRAMLSYDDRLQPRQEESVDRSHCLLLDGAIASMATKETGNPTRRTTAETCPTTPACLDLGGQGVVCVESSIGHATGAWVQPDGRIAWLPRAGGLLTGATPNGIGGIAPYLPRFWIEGAPNEPRLVKSEAVSYTPGRIRVMELAAHEGTGPGYVGAMRDQFGVAPAVVAVHTISTTPGDRATYLLETMDHNLHITHVTGEVMSPPVPVGRLGGALSAQTTEAGTELLLVAGDGRVDRVHVEGDVLALEPLAELGLGPGESLSGAFLVDDHLVAVTSLREADEVRLYRTTTTIRPGTPTPRGAGYGVSAGTAGGYNFDAVVCRPPDGQQPDLLGWTLGGVPATAIASRDGACVLLLRDPSTIDRTLTYTKYNLVTGTLPGIGKIDAMVSVEGDQLGLRYAQTYPIAPLSGGGFVSHTSLTSAGGVLEAIPEHPLDGVTIGWSLWEDLTGAGLWISVPRYTGPNSSEDGTLLHRLSRSPLTVSVADANAYYGTVEGRAANGGLIVMKSAIYSSSKTWTRVGNDGSQTALPALAAQEKYCAELPDGTLCGVAANADYFCTPPGGSRRTGPPVPAGASVLTYCNRFLIENDGNLIGVDETGGALYRYNTSTMTPTKLVDHTVAIARAPDGSIYAWDAQDRDAPTLSKITAGGLVPIPVPAGTTDPCPLNIKRSLAVDGSVALVYCSDAMSMRVPL